MILTKAQAEAVYAAMAQLNNVGGSLSATIQGVSTDLHVEQTHSGAVQVWALFKIGKPDERHANQAAFASAYGLTQG